MAFQEVSPQLLVSAGPTRQQQCRPGGTRDSWLASKWRAGLRGFGAVVHTNSAGLHLCRDQCPNKHRTGHCESEQSDGGYFILFHGSERPDLAQGALNLAPGAQLARFLTEAPFNGPQSFIGTMTFVSSVPVAIANPASIPVSVSLLLKSYDGSISAGPSIVTIPANGQVAAFLNQFSGFKSLNFPSIFQGYLTLSTTAGTGIAVTGLRGRYNEKGEFLITSLPTLTAALSSVERIFPHFVDGGGYSTQFIFPNNMSTAGATLRFFTQTGQNMPLQFR